jgi:hypothetical protein
MHEKPMKQCDLCHKHAQKHNSHQEPNRKLRCVNLLSEILYGIYSHTLICYNMPQLESNIVWQRDRPNSMLAVLVATGRVTPARPPGPFCISGFWRVIETLDGGDAYR